LLPESFETYQIVEPNNIVMRLTDLQNDHRSLRVGRVSERGIITSAYVGLESRSAIDPAYAYYLLHAYDLLKVYYGLGGGLRQTMKFEDLKRLPLLYPSLDEQRRIAAFLDRETAKLDTLIAKQERLIELLQEKRQAVISHAVTKGLDPKVPMKDSGIEWLEEVPAHWDVKRLRFLAGIQTGIAKGKDYADKPTVEVPYLRVANVQDGYLDLAYVATLPVPVEDVDRYLLRAGDVLMNEGGDFDKLGRGHVWSAEIDPCIHQNHVFAIRPHAVSSEWLTTVTGSAYAQFYFMGRSKQSTNLASISSTNIMEFPVVVPPESEQRHILSVIRTKAAAVDMLVEKARRSIDLMSEHRLALISAAVTGKIDVREVA
jgi:type I restriction enzyme S subunit